MVALLNTMPKTRIWAPQDRLQNSTAAWIWCDPLLKNFIKFDFIIDNIGGNISLQLSVIFLNKGSCFSCHYCYHITVWHLVQIMLQKYNRYRVKINFKLNKP